MFIEDANLYAIVKLEANLYTNQLDSAIESYWPLHVYKMQVIATILKTETFIKKECVLFKKKILLKINYFLKQNV